MYHLQVMTPNGIVFDDEVVSLIAPGEEGYLGILTDHAPLLVTLKSGTCIITDHSNKKTYYQISKGFLEVNHNKAFILVTNLELTTPVDVGVQGGI